MVIEQSAAFRWGVKDYRYKLKNNPFKRGTDNYEFWQAGYDSAEFNERYA